MNTPIPPEIEARFGLAELPDWNPHAGAAHTWVASWDRTTLDNLIRATTDAGWTYRLVDNQEPDDAAAIVAEVAELVSVRLASWRANATLDTTAPLILIVGHRGDLGPDTLRHLHRIAARGRAVNVRLALDAALAQPGLTGVNVRIYIGGVFREISPHTDTAAEVIGAGVIEAAEQQAPPPSPDTAVVVFVGGRPDLATAADVIVTNLRWHGFPAKGAIERQMMCLAEEAGEFADACTAWQLGDVGWWDNLRAELADIVITTHVTAAELSMDDIAQGVGALLATETRAESAARAATTTPAPDQPPHHVDALIAEVVVNVCGAVGALIGAYRRYSGQARRTGTAEQVDEALFLVVHRAYDAAARLGIDLDAAIAAKLTQIYARGWRDDAPDRNRNEEPR